MAGLLFGSEAIAKKKKLKPELKRKLFHISSAVFIAFWPWLISWHTIELLGLTMVVIVLTNKFVKVFNFTKDLGRVTHGDVFLALAVSVCAYLAHSKIFFALAILNVALADGLAALAGQYSQRKWKYKIFDQPKTIMGTMAFWIVSVCIFAGGLLFGANQINFNSYIYIIVGLPPLLALIENISPRGSDNLSVPLTVVIVLRVLH